MSAYTGMSAPSEKVGGLRRFFDISVPRNIAPDINEAVSGRVYNVDDLKEVVSKNKEERRKAADEARQLLDQEQLTFEAWRDSLETVPTIKVSHLACLPAPRCSHHRRSFWLFDGHSVRRRSSLMFSPRAYGHCPVSVLLR